MISRRTASGLPVSAARRVRSSVYRPYLNLWISSSLATFERVVSAMTTFSFASGVSRRKLLFIQEPVRTAISAQETTSTRPSAHSPRSFTLITRLPQI